VMGLGLLVTEAYRAPLALGAVLSYAVSLIALHSAPDRFSQNERVFVTLA